MQVIRESLRTLLAVLEFGIRSRRPAVVLLALVAFVAALAALGAGFVAPVLIYPMI